MPARPAVRKGSASRAFATEGTRRKGAAGSGPSGRFNRPDSWRGVVAYSLMRRSESLRVYVTSPVTIFQENSPVVLDRAHSCARTHGQVGMEAIELFLAGILAAIYVVSSSGSASAIVAGYPASSATPLGSATSLRHHHAQFQWYGHSYQPCLG
jgi:hypothetical protein